VGVARLVVADVPLAGLWSALRIFLEEWLLQPGEGAQLYRESREATYRGETLGRLLCFPDTVDPRGPKGK
jgi:hypothetical protein